MADVLESHGFVSSRLLAAEFARTGSITNLLFKRSGFVASQAVNSKILVVVGYLNWLLV